MPSNTSLGIYSYPKKNLTKYVVKKKINPTISPGFALVKNTDIKKA